MPDEVYFHHHFRHLLLSSLILSYSHISSVILGVARGTPKAKGTLDILMAYQSVGSFFCDADDLPSSLRLRGGSRRLGSLPAWNHVYIR